MEYALKRMSNDKTPGQDGLTADFYKVFWTRLKTPFMDMMNYTQEEERLHDTARKGILNLIPKNEKDTRYIKDLIPITLLNTDYKIIEKTIADKMLPALEHIICEDQRGFMKDRRISVNIRKMLDIMHHAQKEDLEAVIVSLDFVKCFDKCSFSILHGSLDYFGFGQVVKQWTKILYDDFTVKIQNNGYFSEPIPIKKGVHQGGCCSSVYFLVIAEILAIALRENIDIDGITIKDIRNLLNQFADDMDIFSLCNEKSVQAIYQELEYFRKQSGFTVSYDKTTIYRVGSLRHSNAQMYNMNQFAWSNADISVLGITIAHEDLVDKNYQSICHKVKKVLNAWYNRGLSLLGKVQVVNTLVASLFVHKMMVLPNMPKNIRQQVDNLIRDYLWCGKKSKIAYNILQNPKSQGGLNLVNLEKKEKALKATWPKILSTEKKYAQIVYDAMRCSILGHNIWRCNWHPKDVPQLRMTNQFWENTMQAWSEYNYYNNRRTENQIIWYNSDLKIIGKIFFWKDAYEKGLLYMHQLFCNQNFKHEETIREEFGLNSLRYNSLKAALNKDSKEFFKSTPKELYTPLPPWNIEQCIYQTGSVAQTVYKFLSDDAMLIHNKFLKWRSDLDQYEDTLTEFAEKHAEIYKITNIAKYRSFQYRLLQRGLVTAMQLTRWKIIDNKNCFFCNNSDETIKHVFLECTVVQ